MARFDTLCCCGDNGPTLISGQWAESELKTNKDTAACCELSGVLVHCVTGSDPTVVVAKLCVAMLSWWPEKWTLRTLPMILGAFLHVTSQHDLRQWALDRQVHRPALYWMNMGLIKQSIHATKEKWAMKEKKRKRATLCSFFLSLEVFLCPLSSSTKCKKLSSELYFLCYKHRSDASVIFRNETQNNSRNSNFFLSCCIYICFEFCGISNKIFLCAIFCFCRDEKWCWRGELENPPRPPVFCVWPCWSIPRGQTHIVPHWM